MNKFFIVTMSLIFTLIFSIGVIFLFIVKPSLNNECTKNIVAKGSAKIGGHFKLTDVNNIEVSSKIFITEPSLIYFGYSYCPDVCPYDLQRNVIAIDMLQEKGTSITPIFITIDPLRDTADRLKEFSNFIHPKLLALTGSENAIKKVMKIFKVYGKKSNNGEEDNTDYLMDHSAFTYLVDSSGKFIDYFNRRISAEEMADRITCFLK